MARNESASLAGTTGDPDHGLLILRDLQQSEPTSLPVSCLRGTISPRLAGQNEAHARALAEMNELPPILVDKQTMRVVDGVHRVRAAVLRGQTTINAVFTEGSADDLFLLAVTLNARHGLPLSLADRKAAALRIVGSHPDWSDHAIAAAAGLAATTIAGIRRQCSSGVSVQSNTRLGRDGRVRPVDGTEGRRRAAAEVRARPGASIREIAQAAGVSLGTAHAVSRLVRGSPAATAAASAASAAAAGTSAQATVDLGTPAQVTAAAVAPGPGTAHSRTPAPDTAATQRPGGAERPGVAERPGGERPMGAGAEPRPGRAGDDDRARGDAASWAAIQESMRQDPAMRYSASGRLFLRWLEGHVMVRQEWAELLQAVPPHRSPAIATLARSCARQWLDLVAELERQNMAGQ